jgi:hypothetical protein
MVDQRDQSRLPGNLLHHPAADPWSVWRPRGRDGLYRGGRADREMMSSVRPDHAAAPEVTFAHLWERAMPEQLPLERLPPIAAVTPDRPQVWVARPRGRLDALQAKPWVRSVVAAGDVVARVRLPHIRSLYITGWLVPRLGRRTISNLSALEELVAPSSLSTWLLWHTCVRSSSAGSLPCSGRCCRSKPPASGPSSA